MKKTRRFAAIAAAAMMTAALAVPMMSMNAFAVETGRVQITATKDADQDSLQLFQIFEVSKMGDVIIVENWGDGVDVSALITDLKADATIGNLFDEDDYTGKSGAQKVGTVLSNFTSKSAGAEAFAKIAAKNIKSDQGITGTKEDSGNVVFSSVPYGYYVAVNTSAVANPEDTDYTSYTLGILQVVAADTVTGGETKIDFPSFDKLIGDVNDSASPATVTYNEAADHDMGDQVPFKLVATIPSNVAKYDTYKMIFHDNLQADVFDLNTDSFKLTYYASKDSAVGIEVELSADAISTTVVSDKWDTTHTGEATEDFAITLSDIKSLVSVDGETIEIAGGGQLVVEYTAELTTSANMGATGNWNGAYLEYSNNPNYSGSGENDRHDTEDSPKDYVVAFTYQTVVNKINGTTNESLAGAEFTLYKKMTTAPESGEEHETEKGYYKVVEAVKSDGDAQFVFNGLDDGDYLLVESEVPEGFNGIEPVKFSIAATETQTDGEEALESLSGSSTDAEFADGKVYVLNEVQTKYEAAGADNGSLSTTIENFKGSELPSTGGIGTTLFYVVGGVLVVGAGVTLITKKRIGKDAE